MKEILSNKSRDFKDSYSLWRYNANTKNQYCSDIDFVEYTYYNGKIIPYVLIEIAEPTRSLSYCSWNYYLGVNGKKLNQAKVLDNLSKKLEIPWFIVLSFLDFNKERVFKIYNFEKDDENIYSEKEYLEWLNEKRLLQLKY